MAENPSFSPTTLPHMHPKCCLPDSCPLYVGSSRVAGPSPPPGVDKCCPALLVAAADHLTRLPPDLLKAQRGAPPALVSLSHCTSHVGGRTRRSFHGSIPTRQNTLEIVPQRAQTTGAWSFQRHLGCCICFLMRNLRLGD